MKVFCAGLLILISSFVAAAPVRAAQPIRVAVLVPYGYPAYADWNAARDEVQRWTDEAKAWMQREVGMTFNSTVELVYSQHDIYWLSANGTYLDGCPYAPVPGGQGASWNHVFNAMVIEAGWADSGTDRQFVVMIGAGGWAGGSFYGHGSSTFGRALLGDWGLKYRLLGTDDPCSPWPTADMYRAFGVEFLHMMGLLDPPEVMLGDPLTTIQKRELVRLNKAFLY